jgi:hypothetical protein
MNLYLSVIVQVGIRKLIANESFTKEIDVVTVASQILDSYNWFRPKDSPITL